MKKYLKINNRIIAIFILLTLCVVPAFGGESLKYYRDLLENYGFQILDTAPLLTETGDSLLLNDYYKGQDLVFFSSGLLGISNLPDLSYTNKVFVICDVPFNLGNEIFCDLDSVSSTNPMSLYSLEYVPIEGVDLSVVSKQIGRSTFILLPQMYFTTPSYFTYLDQYFLVLASYGNDTTDNNIGFSFAKDVSYGAQKSLIYSILLVIVLLVFGNSISKISSGLKSLKSALMSPDFFQDVLKLLEFGRPYFGLALLVMLFIYFPTLWVIVYKDTQKFDLLYVVTYLSEIINPFNLSRYIDQDSYFSLAIFIYNYIFLLVAFLWGFPRIWSILKSFKHKFSGLRANPSLHFYLTVSSLLFLLSLVAIMQLYNLQIIFIVGLFLLVSSSIVFVPVVNAKRLVSVKQKIVYTFLSFFIFSLSVYMIFDNSRRTMLYDKESLIDKSNFLTLLPHTVKIEGHKLFDDLYVSPPYRVFVDNFMLYDPNFKRIENVNISKFDNTGNFIVIYHTDDSYLSDLVGNSILLRELYTSEISNVFKLYTPPEAGADLQLHMKVSCLNNPGFSNIKLKTVSSIIQSDNDIIDLATFPGCSSDQSSLNFIAPFHSEYIAGEEKLYELILRHDLQLIELSVTQNEQIIPVTFISPMNSNSVLIEKINDIADSSITVYSFAHNTEFLIDRKNEDINISALINALILRNVVEDEFTIWSNLNFVPFYTHVLPIQP